ncbi:glycosyltransferase family 2 protein [Desulfuromonas acetexigens]|uniref:Glycosyltransferase n=1 Tax=Trichloromonas acetexigens TaxID=38815 RepID=A0A550JHS0_9BACT|nr:glycosyltransferase [Desulfuromonas acetexigens]TRO82736.1 glycosyltransferase [Desulfuromonas acetexigens]
MSNQTVSVVIPSYNHHRYVLQAIESVLAQTWSQVDLIVIDDGSSDGSAELIQTFWEERGGFTYLRRENRGLIQTLNQGLELAKGQYFCELASDDYLPVDSLEKRATFLNNHQDCVAVFADGYMVWDERETSDRFLDEKRRRLFDQKDPIPDLLRGTLPVFATGMFLTSTLKEIGGFDCETFRYYEDLEMPVRLCQKGKVGFLDEPVFFRRDHETNTSRVTRHIRAEKVRCFDKFAKDPSLYSYRTLISHCLRRHYLSLGRYLHQGHGTAQEKEVFRGAWNFVWRDPRLVWYLLNIK